MENNNLDDLVDLIRNQVKEIRKMALEIMPFITQEIDKMIINKEKSGQRIESKLDQLLDYISIEVGKEEFRRLNDYYRSVNPENASSYDGIYRELYGE